MSLKLYSVTPEFQMFYFDRNTTFNVIVLYITMSEMSAFKFQRLQTLESSICWAKGRILQLNDADELLPIVAGFIQQVQIALAAHEGVE